MKYSRVHRGHRTSSNYLLCGYLLKTRFGMADENVSGQWYLFHSYIQVSLDMTFSGQGVICWTNVALVSQGATCSAVSQFTEKSGCERAIDGKSTLPWTSNCQSEGAWFQVELCYSSNWLFHLKDGTIFHKRRYIVDEIYPYRKKSLLIMIQISTFLISWLVVLQLPIS